MSNWAVIAVLAVAGILLLLIIRLSIHMSKLQTSMAKLGYVIREDAKKYFDDAAHSIVQANDQFQGKNIEIIRKGTKSALSDAGHIMEESLAKAQADAGKVALEAREEARRIIESARQESIVYKQQALEQSVATIQMTLEQYVAEALTVEQHEELIKRLVEQHAKDEVT